MKVGLEQQAPPVNHIPTGIFQYDYVFYLVESDGKQAVRKWIKFPTKMCALGASKDIQPEIFPEAEGNDYALDARQSKIACESGAYVAYGDVNTYREQSLCVTMFFV